MWLSLTPESVGGNIMAKSEEKKHSGGKITWDEKGKKVLYVEDNQWNREYPGPYSMHPDSVKELKKWEDKVIYDVRFKCDTVANLEKLDEYLSHSLSRFVTILTNTEALVYKIGRWMIANQNVKSDDLVLLHGSVIESYVGGDGLEWRKLDRMKDFFDSFGQDYRGRWVLVPEVTVDFSVGLAVYFMTQLRKSGAVGLIFSSYGKNNLGEVLVREVEDRSVYQWPVVRYKRTRDTLPEDEY